MEQIERTRRYLQRVRQIYTAVPDRDDACLYYQDDVESFFIHCHHILDWTQWLNTAGASRDDLQEYVNANLELRICADLCTAAKHCGVNNLRTPHRPRILSIRPTTQPASDGGMTTAMRFNILADGQAIDALKLAEACMDLWDEFALDLDQPDMGEHG